MHHTTQVLVLANLAQDALTDMELRYEEFLRSGDETADAAYEHDANEFPPLLGALAALTADNPPQVARWTGISSDAERLRTEILEGGVATRREVNAGTASPDMLLSYDSSGTAEKTFSRINSTFGAAIGAERALLDQRTTTADRASSVVLQVLIWGTALTVVLGLALAIDVASRIGRLMQRFASAAQLADAPEADRADRIRAQARAEYLQHQTESILSSAAEGIFSQNLDGICLLVNPAVSEVTGFSLEELRGSRIHDLLHHSHPDGTPDAFDECPISNAQRSAESVHSVADVFWRKDGSSARSVDDLVHRVYWW